MKLCIFYLGRAISRDWERIIFRSFYFDCVASCLQLLHRVNKVCGDSMENRTNKHISGILFMSAKRALLKQGNPNGRKDHAGL